jgi:hypothetical protein
MALLYFAYGSNMVRQEMAARCPAARIVGAAVLRHYRFAVIRGGHGTVLRRAGATTHGVLWRLGRGEARALDRYEEVASGLYHRARGVVWRAGRPVRALVYVAAVTAPGRAKPPYSAAIVAAARDWGFPAAYVGALETIARTSSGVRPAALRARSARARSRLA